MGIKIENKKQKATTNKQIDFSEILSREIHLFGNGFSNKNKEQWYAELSILLKSGINLKNGLELLADTQKNQKNTDFMNAIVNQLVEGHSFSAIIAKHKFFTNYEYYAIKIGEQTGELAKITQELSEFFKRKNDLKREIVSALTYPLIVLATAIIVILFMMRFVVPMFVDIFKQNKVELPGITRFIVDVSNFIGNNGYTLIIIFGIFISFIVFNSKKKWFTKYFGIIIKKLPILGQYFVKIYLAQFTQAISLLISARVPMTNSIELVKNMISFYPLQSDLIKVNQSIIEGNKLSTSFSKCKIFDKKMIAMIKVAEETNQTEFIFEKLNDQYNQQVKHQSQVISNTLNPILTILVGIIVGVILIAMYLPMFRLSTVIG